VRWGLVATLRIVIGGAVFLSSPLHAQVAAAKPAVFVRQVRIDSLLLAFGVDSSRVRAAVVSAVRDAHRLAPEPGSHVPSLDVDVTAMRLATGGMAEPRGFVRIEIGRNLMEAGVARSLAWEGTQDLSPSPTWRELSRGTLATVLRVVNNYLLSRSGGA
jgi:hypothetical protein